jgi:ABC-type uncharacterized transport system permease subunit
MNVGYLLLSAFTALSLLHVYWAFGGRWGWNVALPEQPVSTVAESAAERVKVLAPSRASTLAVAGALAIVALVVGLTSGVFAPPQRHWTLTAILTVAAMVFLVRAVGDFRWVGFFKRSSRSIFAFWDTAVYSPLCVALGLGLLKVAIG